MRVEGREKKYTARRERWKGERHIRKEDKKI